MFDPRLLVGYDSSDDACVYSVSDDVAVIETVDFFTPIVDDPYLFGQIAAANALSDVYAMGGVPKLAMNLLCVPSCLPLDTVRAILEGGHDKAVEAGCVIAGGHTIQDDEPKYGLCVTGFIHPQHILKNIGAQPGDVIEMRLYDSGTKVAEGRALSGAPVELNVAEPKLWSPASPFLYDMEVALVRNGRIVKIKGLPLPDASNGEDLWQKLVRPASNIELVVCGHISGSGFRTDRNSAGKDVHQMLFDAQSMGGGYEGNGGDGWIRILEFMPDGVTVKATTFSPLFAISPTTRQFAWMRDAKNEFTFRFSK